VVQFGVAAAGAMGQIQNGIFGGVLGCVTAGEQHTDIGETRERCRLKLHREETRIDGCLFNHGEAGDAATGHLWKLGSGRAYGH
jgi:hypothetical protein